MSHLRIAILGAAQSGKTRLAQALGRALEPATAYAVFDDPVWDQPLAAGEDRWDLILLTGLDLAVASPAQMQTDQTLRTTLAQHALPYATVYGSGAARCANALQVILFHLRDPATLQAPPSRWKWPCEKCSDPECEHRLFSALLNKG